MRDTVVRSFQPTARSFEIQTGLVNSKRTWRAPQHEIPFELFRISTASDKRCRIEVTYAMAIQTLAAQGISLSVRAREGEVALRSR